MSTNIDLDSPLGQLPENATEIARRVADAARETTQKTTEAARDVAGGIGEMAQEVTNATKDAAHRVADTAKDMCQAAAAKAEDSLATSKEYVRQNPVPVVLGAIALGAALGYLMARRKTTFAERFADEPLTAVREAILSAFSPVAQRVHEGYDSARDSAGKALDRAHRFNPGRAADAVSDQVSRLGNNLKFW